MRSPGEQCIPKILFFPPLDPQQHAKLISTSGTQSADDQTAFGALESRRGGFQIESCAARKGPSNGYAVLSLYLHPNPERTSVSRDPYVDSLCLPDFGNPRLTVAEEGILIQFLIVTSGHTVYNPYRSPSGPSL